VHLPKGDQVVLPRSVEGLPEGVLGGVGLLKLSPRPGLAAGNGTGSSMLEPGEGRNVDIPSEVERRRGEGCGLSRGVFAGFGSLLSMRCSSTEGSLE
jgi:hypothetical protein